MPANLNATTLQAGIAFVRRLVLGGGPSIFAGAGAPPSTLGANGDYYFRQDTPGVANQRLYVKAAGAWVGIV